MRSHVEIAKDAIELVKPAINNLFGRTNRKELHIVVLDPRVKPWEVSFNDAILYETSLGNPKAWTIPFDELARKKAEQAFRHSAPNILQQTIHPTSLKEDDILYFGSFVYGDIIVACSGVQQWFDMLVSGWIAVAIEQLMMHEYQTSKIENPTKTYR